MSIHPQAEHKSSPSAFHAFHALLPAAAAALQLLAANHAPCGKIAILKQGINAG